MSEDRLQAVRAAQTSPVPLGELGLSEELRGFVAEMPYERRSILDFVMSVAAALPADATVLDLGAGDAPYRELFAGVRYLTNDWQESVHPGARKADVVGPAWALSLADSSIDLVLCTQVLEHIAEPLKVLEESFRVLAPGGTIALTVPFVWQLHELPHDYYRYAPAGLSHLLGAAGFVDPEIVPRNDSFTTLAQMVLNVAAVTGSAPDGLDAQRERSRVELTRVASGLAALAPLDTEWSFPLGYTAKAFKR